MSKVLFLPTNHTFEVEDNTKVLLAARHNKVAIRFGCAACRCGTCAVRVKPSDALSDMKDAERGLLAQMKLPVDGSIRLSCQARIAGDCQVDIGFQDEYSPDTGMDENLP